MTTFSQHTWQCAFECVYFSVYSVYSIVRVVLIVHCTLVQSSRILLGGDKPCLLLLLITFLHFRNYASQMYVVHKYMQIFIQVSSLENQMGCCNYTLHLVGCLALNKPQATTTTVESHKRHKNSFLRSLISPCLDTNIMACRVVHCLQCSHFVSGLGDGLHTESQFMVMGQKFPNDIVVDETLRNQYTKIWIFSLYFIKPSKHFDKTFSTIQQI